MCRNILWFCDYLLESGDCGVDCFLLIWLGSILLGRHAYMLFDVFPEEGNTGEVEFIDDFLDAFGRLLQQVLDILHDILFDEGGSRVATHFLANGRQIFGRDMQFVGIESHAAWFGIRSRKNVDKLIEQIFC